MNIQHSFIWLLVYLHISNNIRGTFLFFFTHFAWFSVEFFKIGMLRVMNIHISFPSQWNICLIIGPAHKEKVALSDSSARDENRSVMTKRWKKNQHFYLWFWMKTWFHKSPLINADLSGKIYVPQGEESATMSHSTVTPAPFRSDFEVGHLISMWKRPAFKIYNNVLRKKKNIYIAFVTTWNMCFTLKNSEADKGVFVPI